MKVPLSRMEEQLLARNKLLEKELDRTASVAKTFADNFRRTPGQVESHSHDGCIPKAMVVTGVTRFLEDLADRLRTVVPER